jgi:hypothetical protein
LGLPVDVNVPKQKYAVWDFSYLKANSQIPTIPQPVVPVAPTIGSGGGSGGDGTGKFEFKKKKIKVPVNVGPNAKQLAEAALAQGIDPHTIQKLLNDDDEEAILLLLL